MLKHTKDKTIKESTLIIAAPNEFSRGRLEGQYTKLITDTLYEVTGAEVSTKFIIPESNEHEDTKNPPAKPKSKTDKNYEAPKAMVNPKYTFVTFVIGAGNRFAHAASLAVAEAPANA